MKFRVNGSNEIMTFDGTNQRVGIGDTTPSTKLEVAGTITATGLNLQNGSLDYGGGKQQTADLATGWYTFAVCKGRDATISAQRAFGEFLINDVDSGRHGSCRLNATHFFGNGNSIQVFAYNFYSVAVFDELRIKDGGYLFRCCFAGLCVECEQQPRDLHDHERAEPVLGVIGHMAS